MTKDTYSFPKGSSDSKDLPNPAAMPTNKDLSQPEVQSLKTSQEVAKADADSNNKTTIRFYWRGQAPSMEYTAKAIHFEQGFMVVEEEDGRTVVYPAQEFHKVEFGPSDLVW